MASKRAVTIAERIADDFIRSGAVSAGCKMPSIRKLQQRYGSSNTTIGHALNFLEARGEIFAVHGKGCFVADQTQQPDKAHRGGIGLVMPIFANHELAARLTEGAERACQKHGHPVLFATSNGYEDEREAIGRLVGSGCTGIVLWPVPRVRRQVKTDYLNSEFTDTPIVLFDIAYPEQKRSQVIFDNYRAGYQMTEFLIREGHRRVACMDVARPDGEYLQRSTRDRVEGYLDALSAHGLPARAEDHWIIDVYQRMDLALEALMDSRMKEVDRPTALIAIDDTAAVYAIHAAQERGLHVPDDLSVVGFDNLRACRAIRPPFPTSDPNFLLAGEVAVDLLLREIKGQARPPVVYILPVPLLLSGQQRADSYVDRVSVGEQKVRLASPAK